VRDTPLTTPERRELIEVRSEQLSLTMSERTAEAAQAAAISVWRTNAEVTGTEMTALLREVAERTERDARLLAGMNTSESMNLGRDFTAQKYKEQIRYADYSAILDKNTCDNCRLADGFQTQVGSPDYYDVMPPLASSMFGGCFGFGQCRCIWAYSLVTETDAGR